MYRHDCGCTSHSRHHHCNNHCVNMGPFHAVDVHCVKRPNPPMGSVIPFSSGIIPAILTTLASGLVSTGSLVGFGTSIPGLSLVSGTFTLPTLSSGNLVSEAFTVPRMGKITSISANFTETIGITLGVGASAVVNARIYRAPAGSSTFSPTDASVNLSPALTGGITSGRLFSGTADVSVPVYPGDRLVMVFSVSATGTLPTTGVVVTGSASAGITIS